jgi:RNA polymerase sigma-70 factor (ECF subfamily)
MSDERERRFHDMLEAVRPRLVRIARAYAAGDAAQDLYQDILLQIWKSLDHFEGRSQPGTWAYRVALNTAMSWRRKASVPVPPIAAPPLGGQTGVRDPLTVLDEFLASLGKSDRALLLLYLEDASYREIAEVIGISENYVGVKLNRIKRAFTERYITG